MEQKMQIFNILKEIQELAQVGITYAQAPYDLERFEKIQSLVFEFFALQSDYTLADFTELFTNEIGYPTPKIGTKAAVFKNNQILLVQETMDNLWSMPGGWCDYNQSIKSNIIKEVQEEAGLLVKPQKIVSISSSLAQAQKTYYNICRFFILCEIDIQHTAHFTPNIEIADCSFFSLDNLPPLSLKRNTYEHIKLCFEAHQADTWETIFD